jgi:hypothetical protein
MPLLYGGFFGSGRLHRFHRLLRFGGGHLLGNVFLQCISFKPNKTYPMTMPLLMTVSWSVVSWSVLGLKGVLDSPTVLNHNDHIELKWGELVAEEIMSYEL